MRRARQLQWRARAYVRTIEPLEIAPKGKLPEFVAGAIAATIVLLLVAGAAYLGWRIL